MISKAKRCYLVKGYKIMSEEEKTTGTQGVLSRKKRGFIVEEEKVLFSLLSHMYTKTNL